MSCDSRDLPIRQWGSCCAGFLDPESVGEIATVSVSGTLFKVYGDMPVRMDLGQYYKCVKLVACRRKNVCEAPNFKIPTPLSLTCPSGRSFGDAFDTTIVLSYLNTKGGTCLYYKPTLCATIVDLGFILVVQGFGCVYGRVCFFK